MAVGHELTAVDELDIPVLRQGLQRSAKLLSADPGRLASNRRGIRSRLEGCKEHADHYSNYMRILWSQPFHLS